MSLGRNFSISYFRRLVIDLMHFSSSVPSVTVERRLDLSRLIEARRVCVPSPSWSSIFTKAYAVVAARTPMLRSSYMKFPWQHFYEHGQNIATLSVDRLIDNERVVLYAHIFAPETRSLGEIDAIIHRHQEEPVNSIPSFCRAWWMSRVPWPFRRPLWWLALNAIGSIRCHNFGTFGITSVCALGSSITRMVPLLTTTVHYGMFDAEGQVALRLSFDHRVIDGCTAANALAEMEEVLLGQILHECTQGQ